MQYIHESAVVSKSAKIAENVKIGPFCFVGDYVELEEGVELISHVVVDGKTKIGKNTKIYSFASIGQKPQDLKYKNEDSILEIGQNNIIREYCTMQPGTKSGIMKTKIGDNSLFMAGSHVAHDCILGDNLIFANLATLAGHVEVGDNVVIGGLSAVHQFVKIGKYAMIGGVTGVVRDVPPFSTVSSERASIDGMNLIGLKRAGFDKNEIIKLQKAFNKIFFEKSDMEINSILDFVQKEFSDSDLVNHLLHFIRSDSKRSLTVANKRKEK